MDGKRDSGGKIAAKGKHTNSAFHEMESLLYTDIVNKRKMDTELPTLIFAFVHYNISNNYKENQINTKIASSRRPTAGSLIS